VRLGAGSAAAGEGPAARDVEEARDDAVEEEDGGDDGDDEDDGVSAGASADASAATPMTATPTPSAIANPPTRPTYRLALIRNLRNRT